MARSTEPSSGEAARLLDENEQLRTSLEGLIEDNALLAEERDRLRERLREMSQEFRVTQAAMSRQEERAAWMGPEFERKGQTEEELRVAFEELQVLTEELETANTSLHQTNLELDARVAQRTVQLNEINEVLRSTEAFLRAVADLVPELLWRADDKGQADWFNKRWFDYTGHRADGPIGMGWLEALHPDDRAVTRTAWGIAVASGKPFQHEHRIRDQAGQYRWFLVRAEPLRDDKGRIIRWFAAGTDIHDQRLALEALQRSESRFRTLVEGMPQLVWRAVGQGEWTWSSPQWSEFTGQDKAGSLGLGWLDAFHPEDQAAARDAWTRAQQSGSVEIEGRMCHAADKRFRHFRTRALPVRDQAGTVLEWLGTSTDVDDIRQLQEEQAVLVSELQHRTRNLMAVVQAVTTRTLRGASSLEQFGHCIDDRLSALARVQSLLSRREAAARVPFDLLLREELSAHVALDEDGNSPQVRLDGPSGISLRSATVQTFALALHELATNAVKYGALSDRDGQLRVRWEVSRGDGGERMLRVDWRETGISGISQTDVPAGSGYGRELIERALPYQLGARTTYAIEPDGVHCTIEVAVPDEHVPMEKVDG